MTMQPATDTLAGAERTDSRKLSVAGMKESALHRLGCGCLQ